MNKVRCILRPRRALALKDGIPPGQGCQAFYLPFSKFLSRVVVTIIAVEARKKLDFTAHFLAYLCKGIA